MSESLSYFGGIAGFQVPFWYDYNLWESSRYYNTNNLSPRNLIEKCKEEMTATTNSFWDGEDLEEERRDAKNRRIISKRSLYIDPDGRRERPPSSNDWTRKYWHRAGEKIRNFKRPKPVKPNHIEETLKKAMEHPVKNEKAANMMMKMGWEGGALGKSGTGIMEPITPDATYATTTHGFGRIIKPPSQVTSIFNSPAQTPQNPPQKKQKVKPCDVEYFKTNVLLHVRDFVKNEREMQVMFEGRLRDHERRRVHMIIEQLGNPSVEEPPYTIVQTAIVDEINKHNCYLLKTTSEDGERGRILCLYKEAPEHMYLVTIHDLRNDPDETDDPQTEGDDDQFLAESDRQDEARALEPTPGAEKEKKGILLDQMMLNKALEAHCAKNSPNHHAKEKTEKKPEKKCADVVKIKQKEAKFIRSPTMIEKEQNPFLKSILSAQKIQGPVTKADLYNQLMEYFKEFCTSGKHTVFKYLGPFEGIELEVLNEFSECVWICLSEGEYLDDEMMKILNDANCILGMKADANGSAVIFKMLDEKSDAA